MAFVDGYHRGKPARIPDNFARLWPEVYSLTSPSAERAETAHTTTEGEPPADLATDAAAAAPNRKDTK